MHYALHVPYCHYIILAFAVTIRVWKRSVPLVVSNLRPGCLRSQDSNWAMSRTIKDPYFVSWRGTEIFLFFKPSRPALENAQLPIQSVPDVLIPG